VNLRFACPACGQPARVQLSAPCDWQCAGCDHRLHLTAPADDKGVTTCLLCDNSELYKKKDFPHWLGLTILTVACLGSIIPYWLYHQWWTWVILIGSAAFDGLLYLWVGDVVVCYRCQSEYRGLPRASAYQPYELGIAERYRQERIRREQLQGPRKLR
jgi:hypothetical protein